MALKDNALLTIDEGMDALGQEGDAPSYLEGWVNEVSDEIERECHTPIKTHTVTDEIVTNFGALTFTLRHIPIQSITKIEGWNGSTWVEITNANPTVVDEAMVVVSCSLHTYDMLRATYDAGFDEVPADLKRVAREKLIMRWNEEGKGSHWLGKSSLSVGGQMSGSESLLVMSDRWEKVIQRYRPLE